MEVQTVFIAKDLVSHQAYCPGDDPTPYGITFDVNREVLKLSKTLSDLIEDVGEDAVLVIPCEHVSIAMFSDFILPWCQYHHENPTRWDPKTPQLSTVPSQDWDLLSQHNNETLFECIIAANYLDLGELLEQCCFFAAKELFHGKNVDQLRAMFPAKVPESQD